MISKVHCAMCIIVLRRFQIHSDNIVSLLHGIYLNLSTRAEFKVQQNSSCACAARLFVLLTERQQPFFSSKRIAKTGGKMSQRKALSILPTKGGSGRRGQGSPSVEQAVDAGRSLPGGPDSVTPQDEAQRAAGQGLPTLFTGHSASGEDSPSHSCSGCRGSLPHPAHHLSGG